jgi:pimeloyl-ACP methyl ester carboxylesterase
VVFDGLGHLPQQEDPERTVSEVRRFLGMAP